MSEPRLLAVHRLGRVEYRDGLELQRRAADELRTGGPDRLFLLEHPPVLTLGRGGALTNIVASREWLTKQGFEIHETDRGGDVTYHGPGQIVGYPVMDISDRPDVRKFVGELEEAMIRVCADYGLAAGRHTEHRGAWIGTKKVGAVGVHISRWITRHGFAFNVAPDLTHFQTIVPCGIADPRLGVTSLAAELGRAPPLSEVEERLAGHFAELLGRRREDRGADIDVVQVVPLGADGRVLVLKRSELRGGLWQVVTGKIERGEVPLDAARRELREEIGLDVAVESLDYHHSFAVDGKLLFRPKDGLIVGHETAFVGRIPAGYTPVLSDEHVAFEWLPLPEAIERVPWAGLKVGVRLAAARRAPGAA